MKQPLVIVKKIQTWYERYDRPLSSLSLLGGFVFDALTLQRVDELLEIFWVGFHLLVVAVAILLLNMGDKDKKFNKEMSGYHFWLVNILQFFFGGLLSTYLVFYFRSATLTSTWPFLLILALAFIANESFKKHFVRLVFQTGLFFLSVYSFAIFIVPIFLHRIGPMIFILSGVVSLSVMFLFLYILKRVSVRDFQKERKWLVLIIVGLMVVINGLYFTKLIPPLPLALKGAGVYHSITKENGDYKVEYEESGVKGFFKPYDDFHQETGKSVYVYSAVFSPRGLNPAIVHEWQHYDEVKKIWLTRSRVDLAVFGGRDGGFRTYSNGDYLETGKWRVNVETENGAIIGRLHFNIVDTALTKPLSVKIVK